MSNRLKISLDAMGGDRAPEMVAEGANLALERFPEAEFILFGDVARIGPLVKSYPRLEKSSEIRHTALAVTNEDKPSLALRTGRGSSMRLAIDAVADGTAAAVVSAGNTGALMAMSKFVLKMLPGIHRPAIASFFPTLRGESVMLDLGANLQCDADNLVEFAIMGEVFARVVLGLANPTIGLLNVGAEDLKGHDSLKKAAAILRASDLSRNFHGFIEGDDIAPGAVDVIVTDGFTGNVALKTAEGTARLFAGFLREAFQSSAMAKIGYLCSKRALDRLRQRMDPRRYNGAIFLGLNGVAVKSHGSTDGLGFANAIAVAIDMAAQGVNQKIKEEMTRLQMQSEDNPQAAAL